LEIGAHGRGFAFSLLADGEFVLELIGADFEFVVRGADFFFAQFDFGQHAIEAFDEGSDFVASACGGADGVVAGDANSAGGFGEFQDWLGDDGLELGREEVSDEETDERKDDGDADEALDAEGQVIVIGF
jgi:hypothetical protein